MNIVNNAGLIMSFKCAIINCEEYANWIVYNDFSILLNCILDCRYNEFAHTHFCDKHHKTYQINLKQIRS